MCLQHQQNPNADTHTPSNDTNETSKSSSTCLKNFFAPWVHYTVYAKICSLPPNVSDYSFTLTAHFLTHFRSFLTTGTCPNILLLRGHLVHLHLVHPLCNHGPLYQPRPLRYFSQGSNSQTLLRHPLTRLSTADSKVLRVICLCTASVASPCKVFRPFRPYIHISTLRLPQVSWNFH